VDQQQQVAVMIRALGEPGDLGWVVMAHGELYAAEFGWDTSFEALVARIVADYASSNSPGKDAAWLAELHGRRVGCVFCVRTSDEVAQLRILLVDPQARGRSVGRRLVEQCVRFARDSGTASWCCGPTTRLSVPAGSTSPPGSASSRSSRTSASGPSSSARATRWTSPARQQPNRESQPATGLEHRLVFTVPCPTRCRRCTRKPPSSR